MSKEKIQYADDDHEPVALLLRLRLPSLLIGLSLGLGLSFVTSRFEDVLNKNIQVAFFIPFVVYLASAVGEQTQSIYARDLKSGKASFRKYLIKESFLGLILGLIFSLIILPIIMIWFGSSKLAYTVCFATFGAVATAPLIALLVTELLQLEHTDPAVGAGPLATVIQDTVSVVIYGFIASAILL
ncbi:MAG: magnesium transporter [Patescibacteria group bacterium]